MIKVILKLSILSIYLLYDVKGTSIDTYNSTGSTNQLSCLPTLAWGSPLSLGQSDIKTLYQVFSKLIKLI